MDDKPRIRVGVSACLLGERVRYDGGDKLAPWLARELGARFELVPVCPEVGIGLGVPREPIQLRGDPEAPRAVGVVSADLDVAVELAAYGRAQAARLADVCGYVFKSRSPSCGLSGVKLHDASGEVVGATAGLYARQILRALPGLPVAEEGELADPAARRRFIERIEAYAREKGRHPSR